MCVYNHGPRARRSWQISVSIKQSVSSYHWLEVYYRLILYELHFYLRDGVTKLSYCKTAHIHTVSRLQQNRHRERELSHCVLYMFLKWWKKPAEIPSYISITMKNHFQNLTLIVYLAFEHFWYPFIENSWFKISKSILMFGDISLGFCHHINCITIYYKAYRIAMQGFLCF